MSKIKHKPCGTFKALLMIARLLDRDKPKAKEAYRHWRNVRRLLLRRATIENWDIRSQVLLETAGRTPRQICRQLVSDLYYYSDRCYSTARIGKIEFQFQLILGKEAILDA